MKKLSVLFALIIFSVNFVLAQQYTYTGRFKDILKISNDSIVYDISTNTISNFPLNFVKNNSGKTEILIMYFKSTKLISADTLEFIVDNNKAIYVGNNKLYNTIISHKPTCSNISDEIIDEIIFIPFFYYSTDKNLGVETHASPEGFKMTYHKYIDTISLSFSNTSAYCSEDVVINNYKKQRKAEFENSQLYHNLYHNLELQKEAEQEAERKQKEAEQEAERKQKEAELDDWSKISPFGEYNFSWNLNYVNGVDIKFTYINTSKTKKTIKYITFYYRLTNDVNDICYIRLGSNSGKCTGPLKYGEIGRWSFDALGYTSGDASYMRITKIVIQYMDKSIITLTKDKLKRME